MPLTKASTTGAAVLGDDAFSRSVKRYLVSLRKRPADLRFANARDASASLQVEVGVFRAAGVRASALRHAIAASSRPNAPGLAVRRETLAGRRVTTLVYPGGSTLRLYEHGGAVFYVGTTDEELAAAVLRQLPPPPT